MFQDSDCVCVLLEVFSGAGGPIRACRPWKLAPDLATCKVTTGPVCIITAAALQDETLTFNEEKEDLLKKRSSAGPVEDSGVFTLQT